MFREALFARQGWYPADRREAETLLRSLVTSEVPPTPAVAVLSPHAGWAYSGPTAGRLFAEIEVPERVILLCPMHRAGGANVSLWARGEWETPLGNLPVDEPFARALLDAFPLVREDYEGHRFEHAIEIQLPFVRWRNPGARIVPLRLGRLRPPEAADLGEALARTVLDQGGDTLIAASSDMSHESDYDLVRKNDAMARERVLAMDAPGLMETVERHDITMCGFLPAAVAIEAARRLGATRAREVTYTTSADVSGRRDYVVGYLAARFDR